MQVLVTKPLPRVLFTTGDDLVSRSVQIFTGSKVSHAVLVMPEGDIVHAIGIGVVREPRAALYDRLRYRDVAEYVITVPVNVDNVLSKVGQPYDYPEIASRVLSRALLAATPWLPSAVASSSRRSCARLLLDLDPDRDRILEWKTVSRRSATPIDLAARVGRSFRRLS